MVRTLAAWCLFIMPSLVAAESLPRVVTLETVLDLARQKAPAIAAARARVAQAEERRRASTLFPDPVVTGGYGRGTPKSGGSSGSETSFEVSQTLPAPWGLGARKDAGTAAIAAANDEVDGVTRDVVLEATRLYDEAALGAARAAALSDAAEDARSLSDLVGRRVEVGESPGVDHLRTKVEALRAQADARVAAADAEGTREALNRFLLGALGPNFTLPDDAGEPPASPIVTADVDRAVAGSPALRAAEARVGAARARLGAERAARLPGLELSGFSQNEIDKTSTGVTLGLTIPLWNRNRPGVGLASAELAEAEAEAAGVRARLSAELSRLVRKDRAAQEVAASYRQEILPAARETLGSMRAGLEQGEGNLLSWLEARRSYLETLRAGYDAQLTALVTRAELERIVGGSHERD